MFEIELEWVDSIFGGGKHFAEVIRGIVLRVFFYSVGGVLGLIGVLIS